MGIGALIAKALTAMGVKAGIASAIGYAVSALISYGLSRLVARPGVKGSQGQGARAVTTRGTVEPQKIIYGEALVGGVLAYKNTHDGDPFGNDYFPGTNYQLWAVHVLAGHEVEEITDIWLDEDQILASAINGGSAGGGAVESGTYGPRDGFNAVEIWKYTGTATQTAAGELTAVSDDWTTDHRLRGYPYIVTMFALFEETQVVWEAGDPTSVKALVKGKKVYDPRLDDTQVIDSSTSPVTMGSGSHRVNDSTTWEYFNDAVSPRVAIGDNPALCLADFLRDAKFSPFAGGIDESRIDWEAVAQAADDCDALVPVPPAASPENTQKRFTCNGVIYGTEDGEQNAAMLLSCMNGSLTTVNGKYVMRAGVYESPSDDLYDNDLISSISVGSALDSDQRINTLKATYTDAERSFELTETEPVTISAYKDTRDGGDELIDSIELPMTNNWYEAQRICLQRLKEANEELVIQVRANLKAARLVPGQRINLYVTERSWNPKIFKVEAWSLVERGENQFGVDLVLKEDSADAYTDPVVSDYSTTSNNGTLTIADPVLIPGIDSIPRGMRFGVGSWDIDLIPNSDDGSADSNDGEVYFLSGTYQLLVGGTEVRRTIARSTTTLGIAINTPYEGSERPADGVAYLVWGATSASTRFANSPTLSFQSYQIFVAVYDRFIDQWYAVDDNGVKLAFTPDPQSDVVVARLVKTSSSGGIDSLTPLVSYRHRTQLQNLMPIGWSDLESVNDFLTGVIGSQMTGGMDTSVARRGSRSFFIEADRTEAPSGTVTLSCTPVGLSPYNIRVPAGRRYAFVCSVRPENEGGREIDISIRMNGAGANVDSAWLSPSDLSIAEDAWGQIAFEVDTTGQTDQDYYIQVRGRLQTQPSPQYTADPRLNVDELMLFDITDSDEIVPDG